MTQKRVLIVEDNADNRVVFGTILKHAGYEVVEAANGEDGVRAARDHHPDLILMDLSMPVMDGWQATGCLKADDQTRHIPVCAISAHTIWDRRDQERVESTGFDCYLTKPVDPRRVLEVVQQRIGDAMGSPPRRAGEGAHRLTGPPGAMGAPAGGCLDGSRRER